MYRTKRNGPAQYTVCTDDISSGIPAGAPRGGAPEQSLFRWCTIHTLCLSCHMMLFFIITVIANTSSEPTLECNYYACWPLPSNPRSNLIETRIVGHNGAMSCNLGSKTFYAQLSWKLFLTGSADNIDHHRYRRTTAVVKMKIVSRQQMIGKPWHINWSCFWMYSIVSGSTSLSMF